MNEIIKSELEKNKYFSRLYNYKNLIDYFDINNEENFKNIPREDFFFFLENRKNKIKNIGFDYRNKILKKSLSYYFFIEDKRKSILDKFEILTTWIVEQIKNIKKTYNYILPKNYRDFN